MAHVARKSVSRSLRISRLTLYDVYEICRQRAADMICIGRVKSAHTADDEAAAVAEAAMKICIHSSLPPGITTCAEHHIGSPFPISTTVTRSCGSSSGRISSPRPIWLPKTAGLDASGSRGLGFQLAEDLVAEGEDATRQVMTPVETLP